MKILVNEEDLKFIEESIINGKVLKEDLNRWFKEKWVDVSKKVKGKHPPCGRKKATDKGYPKCRPSKKVSKETPKTAGSYDAKEKKATMENYWVPGVNNLGTYGRWAFAEFTEVYQIEADFEAKVVSEFNKMVEAATAKSVVEGK